MQQGIVWRRAASRFYTAFLPNRRRGGAPRCFFWLPGVLQRFSFCSEIVTLRGCCSRLSLILFCLSFRSFRVLATLNPAIWLFLTVLRHWELFDGFRLAFLCQGLSFSRSLGMSACLSLLREESSFFCLRRVSAQTRPSAVRSLGSWLAASVRWHLPCGSLLAPAESLVRRLGSGRWDLLLLRCSFACPLPFSRFRGLLQDRGDLVNVMTPPGSLFVEIVASVGGVSYCALRASALCFTRALSPLMFHPDIGRRGPWLALLFVHLSGRTPQRWVHSVGLSTECGMFASEMARYFFPVLRFG